MVAITLLTSVMLCCFQCGADFIEYRNKTEEFSINFPKGWEVRENVPLDRLPPSTTVPVVAVRPWTDSSDTFSENIIVEVQSTDNADDVETAAGRLINWYSDDVLGALIASRESITIAGRRAVRFVYHFDMQNQDYVTVNYVVVLGRRVFLIGGGTLATRLDKYESLFDRVAHSLRFIGPDA